MPLDESHSPQGEYVNVRVRATRDRRRDGIRLLTKSVSPKHNEELHRVTSPALKEHGSDVFEVWRGVRARPYRFLALFTGQVFRDDWASRHPSLAPWWSYVSDRYASALQTKEQGAIR